MDTVRSVKKNLQYLGPIAQKARCRKSRHAFLYYFFGYLLSHWSYKKKSLSGLWVGSRTHSIELVEVVRRKFLIYAVPMWTVDVHVELAVYLHRITYILSSGCERGCGFWRNLHPLFNDGRSWAPLAVVVKESQSVKYSIQNARRP